MAGDFVQTLLEVQFSHGTTYQGYSPGIPSTAMTYDLTTPYLYEDERMAKGSVPSSGLSRQLRRPEQILRWSQKEW